MLSSRRRKPGKQRKSKQAKRKRTSLYWRQKKRKNKWYLKLVNAKNPMIDTQNAGGGTETLDSEGYQVDARIMKDLEAMFQAARADGDPQRFALHSVLGDTRYLCIRIK